eukprot:25379_1
MSSFFASYHKYKVFVCSCWYAARGSQAVLSACTIPVMGISRAPPTLQVSISFRTPGVGWDSSTERASYYSPMIFSKSKYTTSSFHERDSTISSSKKFNNIITRIKVSDTNDLFGMIDRSPLPESLRDASTGLDFIEPSHTYVYEGRVLDPSTSVVDRLWGAFDGDAVIAKQRKSWDSKPQSPFYKKSSEEIKAMWASTASEGSKLHTLIHRLLMNDFGTDRNFKASEQSAPELQQVREFLRSTVKVRGWRLVASEMRIFHKLGGIAGTMDALFHEPKANGKDVYHIIEWKRVDKDISSTIKGKYGVHPLVSKSLDSRLARYSTQVHLYAWIIKNKHCITDTRCWIVQIHPRFKQCRITKALDLSSTIDLFMQERLRSS